MKKHISTIILIVILLAGLSLLLYPSISNYWNEHVASRAVAAYNSAIDDMDNSEAKEMLEAAREYNSRLTGGTELSDEEKEEYLSLLDVTGTGIMGYIEIPSIEVSLPIYHTTEDSVLQIAAGHVEWSSLPVGGEGTHCVLSGHRGLPSAKLFTDLDELVVGDTFTITVLNEVLTYQVDQILIVLPEELDALQIEEGQDLCTLVTCTPYGINTHRLLVRGHRVETQAQNTIRVSSEAVQIQPMLVATIVAVPVLIIIVLIIVVRPRKKVEEELEEDTTRGEINEK